MKSAGGIPGLEEYDGDNDDEGYAEGMEEDADDVLPSGAGGFVGPLLPSYQQATATASSTISPLQTWSWNNTDSFKAGQASAQDSAGDDEFPEADVDSNAAINDDDNDASTRLMQDFSDDDDVGAFGGDFDSAHHTSPILQSTEMDAFLGDQMEGVQRFEDIEELETVEIRVDSPPAVHEKKE